MSRARIVIILGCILLIVIGATAVRYTKKTTQNSKGPAPNVAGRGVPVLAEPVATHDVPVYLRGLGSVSAFNTVTVKARVDGQITKINFREGQEVNQGDLLVEIDPRPYDVQLHTAEANLAKDAATRDDRTKLASGKLLTLNNEIDPTTGTNKFKAVFQNEDRVLWPNQFVNIRLLLEIK